MGGFATWDLAAKYPGKFAAFVPVCGAIRQSNHEYAQYSTTLGRDPKVSDPYAETARRIGKTPVWIFHGAVDAVVPVSESRQMNEALKAAGGNVKYTEYEGVNHNSWEKAYAEADFFSWLLSQKLEKN